ncbi:MAG: polyprenyl synthetase family protein [Ruminococcaceae bacterium]|nr:polyprenyl synthetase family protein [Oscillospiraceae bacterium]
MFKSKFESYVNLIEKTINEKFPESNSEYALVNQASRYSLLLGGKRIRPILMLEFAKLFGAADSDVLPFCVAIEMIHTYSLIHDDLPCMDNDDLRRGKPACHKKFGEDIALLAGDNLLTESFKIAADSSACAERKIKAISILAERAGFNGMIGGQVLDLWFEECTPNAEQITRMYMMKTGALLSASAEIGVVLGGGSEEDLQNATNYALNLGLAFQIIDDILDITGDEKLLGKPIGSDADNNKTTLVSILGLENAKALAQELTQKALECLSKFEGNTEFLIELTSSLLNRNY